MKIQKIKDNLYQLKEVVNSNVCCFTGPRPHKLPWGFCEEDERCEMTKLDLRFAVERAIEDGKTHFICGMAQGFDMMAAEMVLEFKVKYPFIKLECALPCKTQCKGWAREQKKRYQKILAQADKIRCIYDKYFEGCMQERNRYMVNNSSLVIALYGGTGGGTLQTIEYAKKQGLKIEILKPTEQQDIDKLEKAVYQEDAKDFPALSKKEMENVCKSFDEWQEIYENSPIVKQQKILDNMPEEWFCDKQIERIIEEIQNRKKKP